MRCILIGFLCGLVLLSTAQAVTVEYQIAAGSDDTTATSSGNNVNTDLIYFPYSADPPSDRPGFFCWELDIPVGATIDSAYLKVNAYDTTTTAGAVRLQLLDYDDCPAFTTNPYSWSVTAGYVDWTLDASWTQGSWYTSSDIKTIVQEFIDRTNYAPGNYLGMKESRASGGYRRIRQWNYGDNTYGAKLEVTYSTNTPPTADADDDQTVTDTDDSGYETVTLDGTGSSDSDGTIVSYVWTEGATQIATGANPDVSLSVGVHTIVLTVTDDDSDTDTDTVVITVEEPAQSTTVEYQIAAGSDDTTATSSGNNVNTDLIYFPYSADPPSDRPGFFCWELDIPVGATIDSAYLKVNAYDNTTTAGAVRLQLLDYDDCPDFTTNPYSWSVTAGYVDWTLDASWTQGAWYTSTDIKTIVQEFIDRANYAPGNYLGMKESRASGGYRRIRQWNYGDNTYGAKLEVTYTTSGNQTNDPPVADADDDQSVTDTDDNGSETVTLDGTGSSDSDGTIVSYVWTEGATQIATGANPDVTLSVGEHTIVLTVTDDDSDTDTDTVVVTVYPYVAAGNYYIDFDGGSDSLAGTSPATAWQHCPGDPNATGTAASTTLSAGDTVIFKGGVHYRGEISVNGSGQSGSPITLDANTAGTYGTGRAILDGSDPLTGWTACTSQADAGGAAQWANMYKTTLPSGVNIHAANLCQGGERLLLAQEPDPGDTVIFYDLDSFYAIPPADATNSTLTDSSVFNQAASDYWDGSYIYLWYYPNVVTARAVTGFDPSLDRIQYEPLTGTNKVYDSNDTLYAMVNHYSLLDEPGEYFVNESTNTLYLWPTMNIAENEVSVSVRRVGIEINGNDYITVQGFLIQKYAAPAGAFNQGIGIINRRAFGDGQHLLICDNEVTRCYSYENYGAIYLEDAHNSIVEDNYIHDNSLNKGFATSRTDNITFENNIIDHNGNTGVSVRTCTNSFMIGNTISNNNGPHGNGMSLYLGNENILVFGNSITGGLIALTSKQSSAITVAYNILSTPIDGYTVIHWTGLWGGEASTDLHYYNNVIINDYNKGLGIGSDSETGLEIKNNIIDGCFENVPGSNITHNIYTSLAWSQKSQYGWYLGDGESYITDKTSIFVDPANEDWHLKTGSPAIDAGTDLGFTEDLDGNAVPQNGTPDIGADEYVP